MFLHNHTTTVDAISPLVSTARDIRLVDGDLFGEGRLEVRVDGVWGTVCDWKRDFRQTEADVACKQLGFGQAASYGRSIDLLHM